MILVNLKRKKKRKIIFNWLVNNREYDIELLEKITKKETGRNSINELMSSINGTKGICNALSQHYKLLLEQVGIRAYCVVCYDENDPKVYHCLNRVYDDDNGTCTFDDITYAIVKGKNNEFKSDEFVYTIDDFFDFNISELKDKKHNLATKLNPLGEIWSHILPEYMLNYMLGRDKCPLGEIEDCKTDYIERKVK